MITIAKNIANTAPSTPPKIVISFDLGGGGGRGGRGGGNGELPTENS